MSQSAVDRQGSVKGGSGEEKVFEDGEHGKAYDMVSHSWIVEILGTVKVADNVKGLLC